VIRRRPTAVYRVIDEDELLFGDGALTWPGGPPPRWSPASGSPPWTQAGAAPEAHAGRRSRRWSRVVVLALVLAAAGAGTLVVNAGPQRAAAGWRRPVVVAAGVRRVGPRSAGDAGLRAGGLRAAGLRAAGTDGLRAAPTAGTHAWSPTRTTGLAADASPAARLRALARRVTGRPPRSAHLRSATLPSVPRATVHAERLSGARAGHRNSRRAPRRARFGRSRLVGRASAPARTETRTRPLAVGGAAATASSTTASVSSAQPSPPFSAATPGATPSPPEESGGQGPQPTSAVAGPNATPPGGGGSRAAAAASRPPGPAAEFGFER
jgi:hypothetical protein